MARAIRNENNDTGRTDGDRVTRVTIGFIGSGYATVPTAFTLNGTPA